MKKDYSLYLMAGLAGITASCGDSVKKETPDRPNIIFIMTDDHAFQAIGAYGSVINQTPNIDRLAREGMLFDHAFVTNSISAPSRAVILTGKHSHLNGVTDNALPFDSAQQTFPKILQGIGYETAIVGKWHLKSEPSGFDFWKVLPGQGSYYNPDFRTPGGMERIEGYVTDIITDVAMEWLNEKRNKDKPFMLMYQHKAPHREWWPGPEQLKEPFGEPLPEPQTLFDDYEGRGKAAREQEMTIENHMNLYGDLKIKPEGMDTILDSEIWETRAFKWSYNRLTPEQREAWNQKYDPVMERFMEDQPEGEDLLRWKYQRYMQDYLGCIASVDQNLGRLLDYLDESGLAENTLIIYTSDQGFYLGEHGWFDKRFMYEESFRTPLIMRWPGHIKEGSTTNKLVQNLDFAETILDVAGVSIPEDMQGMSLQPLFSNPDEADWRNSLYYHYYEYPAVHMVKRHYGIRTDRYKLIHFYFDIDEWELYDLERDPLELNNQIDNPEYTEVIKQLKAELANLQEQYSVEKEPAVE
jgi:arylsulfatase A-like enzyme